MKKIFAAVRCCLFACAMPFMAFAQEETVEILRGPNSSQYGSDVHGGVVNFISHAPRYGGTNNEFHGHTNLFYTSATNGFGGNTLLTYGTRSYRGISWGIMARGVE